MIELENLEKKINRVIQLIHQLHETNQQLKNQNEVLIKELKEKEKIIQQLTEENQKIKADNANFDKEKEEKIRLKIHQMLERLETFQKLSNNNS